MNDLYDREDDQTSPELLSISVEEADPPLNKSLLVWTDSEVVCVPHDSVIYSTLIGAWILDLRTKKR